MNQLENQIQIGTDANHGPDPFLRVGVRLLRLTKALAVQAMDGRLAIGALHSDSPGPLSQQAHLFCTGPDLKTINGSLCHSTPPRECAAILAQAIG